MTVLYCFCNIIKHRLPLSVPQQSTESEALILGNRISWGHVLCLIVKQKSCTVLCCSYISSVSWQHSDFEYKNFHSSQTWHTLLQNLKRPLSLSQSCSLTMILVFSFELFSSRFFFLSWNINKQANSKINSLWEYHTFLPHMLHTDLQKHTGEFWRT